VILDGPVLTATGAFDGKTTHKAPGKIERLGNRRTRGASQVLRQERDKNPYRHLQEKT